MTSENPTFADLGVPSRLVDVLVADGRESPFPIQRETLPSTLAGMDVLGRGKTGSGKTLAFSIPLVARLADARSERRPGHPTGLVLAPTRELANQIAAVVSPLADAAGLTVTTIFGGVSQKPQEAAMRRGVDIVVACPGRLEDLMGQGVVDLSRIAVTVLDEADHMADLGFLPGVTRILSKTPQGGQRMFFSATLDNGVDKLVTRFLDRPVRHSIDPADSPVPAMTHHVFEVETTAEKTDLVRTLASGASRRILFTRTKHQARKLAKQLTASGIPAVDLHGNLSQNARDRNLADFSSGRVRVLVATDVAARGVHVDGVDLVVHVDPPAEHKAYVHRSGRTARAGSAGDVATVMLSSQRQDTRQLLRKAGISAQPQRVTAGSAAVTALVGEVAPHVAPVAGGPGIGNPEAPGAAGTSQGANARRKRAARGGGSSGQGANGSSRQGAGGGSRGNGRGNGQQDGQGSGRRRGAGDRGARPAGQGSGGRRSGQGSTRSTAQPGVRYSTSTPSGTGSSSSSAPRRPRRASSDGGPTQR